MKTLRHFSFVFPLLIALVLLSSCSKDTEYVYVGSDAQSVFPSLDWGTDTTWVIGHKSPDTDATCSALAYAFLMRQLGYNCVARVAGKLNNETKFVLKSVGVETPDVLENAKDERLILTDHSEISQAVSGVEFAHILQIIDHHGLGNISVSTPYFCKTMPVGSTCTVIYSSYKEYNVAIPQQMAVLMLAALLSDTNNMTSSTVSALDRKMYEELLPVSGISNIDAFYQEMSYSAASYSGLADMEILKSDYKEYSLGEMAIGIGVVNTQSENAQVKMRERMLNTMPLLLERDKLAMVFVMLENTKDGYTDILFSGERALEVAAKAFGAPVDSTFSYIRKDGLLSRKKDVVPALTGAIE